MGNPVPYPRGVQTFDIHLDYSPFHFQVGGDGEDASHQKVQHLRIKILFISWVVSFLWYKRTDFVVYGRCMKCLPSCCAASGSFGPGIAENFPCMSHPCHPAHRLRTMLCPTCPARVMHARRRSFLSRDQSKASLKIQE